MHKLFKLILPITLVLFIVSCDEGEPGPPGIDGLDAELAQVLEFEVDFNQANNFSDIFVFPSSVEVFEADAVLVFLLEDVIDDGNGETQDVFTPLPQNFFLDQGTLQYSFNHTFNDVSVLLSADFDLNTLTAQFTDNQVFRVVIVPSQFAQSANLETNNLEAVMKSLNLSNKDIIRISN